MRGLSRGAPVVGIIVFLGTYHGISSFASKNNIWARGISWGLIKGRCTHCEDYEGALENS